MATSTLRSSTKRNRPCLMVTKYRVKHPEPFRPAITVEDKGFARSLARNLHGKSLSGKELEKRINDIVEEFVAKIPAPLPVLP